MRIKTRDIVMIAMYIALYLVLEKVSAMIPILEMANGGKVSLSALVLIIAGYHLKPKKGLLVVILSLVGRFILIKPPYFLNIFQFLADYVIPFSFYAFVSLIPDVKLNKISLPIGVIVADILRLASHTIGGVIFWGYTLKGNIWLASFLYNLPYMVVTCIISFTVVDCQHFFGPLS